MTTSIERLFFYLIITLMIPAMTYKLEARILTNEYAYEIGNDHMKIARFFR